MPVTAPKIVEFNNNSIDASLGNSPDSSSTVISNGDRSFPNA